ncbi:hypothetical protein MRX96_017417 [Rhipicephalus microplus]
MGAPCLPGCKVNHDLGWTRCCRSIEQLWDRCFQPFLFPPPTETPLASNSGLGGLSKRHSPICALKQAYASKIEEELAGRLIA